MTLQEQLNELGKTLPPSALSELVEFAEFLQKKNQVSGQGESIPLESLAGGLEFSAAFADSPLAIQDVLRSEWD